MPRKSKATLRRIQNLPTAHFHPNVIAIGTATDGSSEQEYSLRSSPGLEEDSDLEWDEDQRLITA